MIHICTRALIGTAVATISLAVGSQFVPHKTEPVEGAGDYRAAASGSVYHKPDCYHLNRAKEVVALTKDEAEMVGLRPCKDCIRTYEMPQESPRERSRLASGIRP